MMEEHRQCFAIFFFVYILFCSSQFAISQRLVSFISGVPTLWINMPSIGSIYSKNILNYTPILLEGNASIQFLYGFSCSFHHTECFLGILLVSYSSTGETIYIEGGQLVCSAFSKKRSEKRKAGGFLDLEPILPGILTRFSYNGLKIITQDFSRMLGKGGFGSVYEGTLSNGTKIAVKHLDGVGQVKESFLTEVKTVGGIHHINLVKLIGYCAEKSNRLLIYEYMVNGSLDRWITQENGLTWNTRKRIISDIAKGLAYLHEDCSHKIIHLDIKPQNILLDQNFNAKISDFGLSKLIEKDKSKVVTRMRGTPGYIAPEWLSSIITEKVDVYAFGIVLLEILCGRKNLDWSQTDEEDVHLLTVFTRKVEQEQLTDMVDRNEDMQLHREAVTEMMSLAAWCLQADFSKRPSMSLVVKALEGLVTVETNLDYNFRNVPKVGAGNKPREASISSTLPSDLSGPW